MAVKTKENMQDSYMSLHQSLLKKIKALELRIKKLESAVYGN